MKLSYILFSSFLFLGFSNAAGAVVSTSSLPKTFAKQNACVDLASFTWQHRVLITQVNSSHLSSLLNLLSKNDEALIERKLAVFIVGNNKVARYHNSSKFENTGKPICIAEANARMRNKHTILIGLDGGTKGVYSELDLRAIFADIDGMPMRRGEL